MTVVTAAYLATSPLHYLTLQETSGTTAASLAGGLTGSCVGMTMGGTDGPEGIGGKAPLFTGGSERILLSSAKILGGLPAWSIAAWVKYNPAANDEVSRRFYGEANPTTGNDQLAGAVNGGSSSALRLLYGADGNAPTELGGLGIYIHSYWTFVVFTKSGATIEEWWNVGRRVARSDAVASNTWTDSGIVSWIGNLPRTGSNPWKGSVAHLALYDRVLSKADQQSIYWACTPETRTIPTRKFFRDNSIWNQDLTVPGNAPLISSESTAIVPRLAAQATGYGTGCNTQTGVFFTSHNTDPQVRVGILDGPNNFTSDHPYLYNALGQVRMPTNFDSAPGGDAEGSIYNADTDELWEFIELTTTMPGTSVSLSTEGTGTLPAGVVWFWVAGATADGRVGGVYGSPITVNGSQGVRINWNPIDAADHYVVYRHPGDSFTAFDIAHVAVGTTTFLDNGSLSPGAGYVGITATGVGWTCKTAGYMADTDDNVGHFEAPRQNWGATATALPLWGGSVSIHEGRTGVIDHAIALAIPEVLVEAHVYPAQRNDGWFYGGNGIREGTRFQLDPSYDINTIAGAFERSVAAAMQKYGAYVRDVSNTVSVYTEHAFALGRDAWTQIFEGRYDYEVFGSDFPWDEMRVIDPSWTQAQTQTAVSVPPAKWASFFETFDAFNTVSTWTVTSGSASVINEELHIPPPYGLVETQFVSDLLESDIVFDMRSTGAAYAEGDAEIILINGLCKVQMGIFADTPTPPLIFMTVTSSADVTTRLISTPAWNAVTTRYWRISESAGTIRFYTSANGGTWTEHNAVPRSTLGHADAAYQSLTLQFQTNAYGVNPPALPDFIIGGVNTIGVSSSGTPSINLPTSVSLDSHITELVIDGD